MIGNLPLNKIKLLILLLVLCGCRSFDFFKKEQFLILKKQKNYKELSNNDYENHLKKVAEDFVSSGLVEFLTLSRKSKDYFNNLYKNIIRNNELFLKKKMVPKIFIIDENSPVYFSLPGGYFFFSSGLIKRYVKSEELLIPILVREIVRVHKLVYKKQFMIPSGHVTIDKVIKITRLPIGLIHELNKWSLITIRRSGYDQSSLLSWLQIQNKNMIDFSRLYRRSWTITREEYLLKSFTIKEGLSFNKTLFMDKNSSNKFYAFLKEVRE